MNRRVFLGTVAGAALAPAASAWSDDRLGLAINPGTDEAKFRSQLSLAAKAGYRRIQLFPPWAAATPAYLAAMPGWVKAEGLEVPALGVYVNCCRPDVPVMGSREEHFVQAIDVAATYGATTLVAWTGGHAPGLMTADPANFTPASEENIRRFIHRHIRRLDDARLRLALEQYSTLTCPDAPSLGRLLSRVPDSVGAVLDPPNLTLPADYALRDQRLEEMFRILAGRVAIVHLKDLTLAPGGKSFQLPGPMQGDMNYPLFAKKIATLPPTVPLFAEHIGSAQYAETREKLLPVLRAAF